jgi:predicted dehydrogenase
MTEWLCSTEKKPMQKVLGAAVIGAGVYGQVHARAYSCDPRTRLVAVWSRSEDRRGAVARNFGCEAVADVGKIGEDPRIQLVSIATPDFAHADPAVRMLEAGKHVICTGEDGLAATRVIEAVAQSLNDRRQVAV